MSCSHIPRFSHLSPLSTPGFCQTKLLSVGLDVYLISIKCENMPLGAGGGGLDSCSVKPGSHLYDKDKHKHKNKLATFPLVKQAQENKANASAVTFEEIWKLIQDGGFILLVHALTSRRFALVK